MTRKPSTSPHRSHPSPRRGVSVLSFLFSVLFALPASVGLLRSLPLRVPLWSFVSFVMTHKPSTVPHRSHPSPRRGVSVLCSLFSVLFALHAPALTLPLLDEGPVRAGFESAAETLSYEAPLEGTLWIETPAAAEARLPPDFRDRFRGFAVVEDFAEGRTETAGRARAAWRLRLTPAAEGPWRLRPFVLTVRDRRTGAMQDYATRLAAFPAPPPLPAADGAPEVDWGPLRVPPPWQVVAKWVGLGLGALLLLAALVLLGWPRAKRLARALRERTLSPEERARLELGRLLAERLPQQGRVKRFYYALTDVVRRYFERAYATRATRQTTQEFLAGLARRAAVSQPAQDALAAFLAAADRVKYADRRATPDEADAAADAARALIDADAASRAARHDAGKTADCAD